MISQTALHAVHALTEMASHEEKIFFGTADLARSIHAPANYLGKLLQSLIREGIVESQRGKNGGFGLKKSPSKISLYDIVEPIDHVSRFEKCILDRGNCGDCNACSLHKEWGAIRDRFLRMLHKTSIASLAVKKV